MLIPFQNKLFYCVVTMLSCFVSVIVTIIYVSIIYNSDEFLQWFMMISISVRFIALILAFCFFQKKLNEKRFRFLFIYSDAIVCALILFSLCVLIAGGNTNSCSSSCSSGILFNLISPSIVLILTNFLCYVALRIGSRYLKDIFSF